MRYPLDIRLMILSLLHRSISPEARHLPAVNLGIQQKLTWALQPAVRPTAGNLTSRRLAGEWLPQVKFLLAEHL